MMSCALRSRVHCAASLMGVLLLCFSDGYAIYSDVAAQSDHPPKRAASSIILAPYCEIPPVVSPDANSLSPTDEPIHAIAERQIGVGPRVVTIDLAGLRVHPTNDSAAGVSMVCLGFWLSMTDVAVAVRPYVCSARSTLGAH